MERAQDWRRATFASRRGGACLARFRPRRSAAARQPTTPRLLADEGCQNTCGKWPVSRCRTLFRRTRAPANAADRLAVWKCRICLLCTAVQATVLHPRTGVGCRGERRQLPTSPADVGWPGLNDRDDAEPTGQYPSATSSAAESVSRRWRTTPFTCLLWPGRERGHGGLPPLAGLSVCASGRDRLARGAAPPSASAHQPIRSPGTRQICLVGSKERLLACSKHYHDSLYPPVIVPRRLVREIASGRSMIILRQPMVYRRPNHGQPL